MDEGGGSRTGGEPADLALASRLAVELQRADEPAAVLDTALRCCCALHDTDRGFAVLLGSEGLALRFEGGVVELVPHKALNRSGEATGSVTAVVPGADGPAAVLVANGPTRTPPAGAIEVLTALAGSRLHALLLRRLLRNREHQLDHIAAISRGMAEQAELDEVARRIVEGVVAVTDFRVATLTLREGDQCRRIAAAGLAVPRIGLTTPYERWLGFLREEDRCGRMSYLIPPDAPAEWSEVPDLPPPTGPYSWSADQGLVAALTNDSGEPVGFLSVDEPRSGKLPRRATIETLERFAAQVQVALANARLYDGARRAAERDGLTGLSNRAVLWSDLAAALAQEPVVSLAVLDVDDFKAVNDHHGHLVGDRVLIHVADRLGRTVRETDRVYRLGGEEFAMLLPGATVAEAADVAERARRAVTRRRPRALPAVTVSVGVAQHPEHGTDSEALYAAADAAMYVAKRSGKNRVSIR